MWLARPHAKLRHVARSLQSLVQSPCMLQCWSGPVQLTHVAELPEFHAQVLYATGLTWLHMQLTLVWSWHGLVHSPQAPQG